MLLHDGFKIYNNLNSNEIKKEKKLQSFKRSLMLHIKNKERERKSVIVINNN